MRPLNIVERVIALEGVQLFEQLSPDQLARIAAIAKETAVIPGAVVLSPEKRPDTMFVVLDGAVEILREGEVLHIARQNEVLGMWALFDDEPLPVSATALEDTRLLRIHRADFYELLADNMEIGARILATLARRFRQLAGS